MNAKTTDPWYYDCHCHILPGVDDGARNLEETWQLLRMEYDQGVRTILATPHFHPKRYGVHPERLEYALEQTRELARRMDPQFQIHLWNEAYWEGGLIYHLNQNLCRTAGDRYVLIESRYDDSEETLLRMVEILQANDYNPVFAHIERYSAVRRHPQLIDTLRQRGAWIQVNGDSLMGRNGFFTAVFCRTLLRQEKIDLIGTDCHRTDFRPPRFQDCARYLQRHTRSGYYDLLMREHPQQLLEKEQQYDADKQTSL